MPRSSSSPLCTAKLGIVAGGGSLPREAAEAVMKRGGGVHIAAVAEAADADFGDLPNTPVYWSALGKTLGLFRRAGVEDVLFLGRMFRPRLATARPDWTFLKALPEVVRLLRQGGDDALLRALIGIFEKRGFRVVGLRECAPELLVGVGPLGQRKPETAHDRDVALGMNVIAALGPFDIGQAVVCRDGAVIAIEGAEGTDRMLARLAANGASSRRRDGLPSGVLVKRPKPGQDLRIDLPAIGPDTVAGAHAAHLAGIAVMADHVIVAEREKTAQAADAAGLFVAGLDAGAFEQPVVAETDFDSELARWAAGRHGPDARLGVQVIEAAASVVDIPALVVRRGRVIAVAAADSIEDMLARVHASRRHPGCLVLGPGQAVTQSVQAAMRNAGIDQVVAMDANKREPAGQADGGLPLINRTAERHDSPDADQPKRIFIVCGEHSGDALGGKLVSALRTRLGPAVAFKGVGGEDMAAEGVASLYPISDVAVMGPQAILRALPLIRRRVLETVDAIVADDPDVLVIIDSPEFTHPIAKRVRRRAPHIPIVDYVSPSVWAWRPGRAKRMRRYVDLVLALLPFEPAAHRRLGGPACVYVGHSLGERADEILSADGQALARKLGLAAERPVLLVLPGSRRSEIAHLLSVFGETVAEVNARSGPIEVIIPAVPHLRDMLEEGTRDWAVKPHFVSGHEDKYAAMRLARAALAASGTVTLELALAGTPTVVAYRVDKILVPLRFLLKVESVVLANLVLGKSVFPEFLQEQCTVELMVPAVLDLISDTPVRRTQIAALAETRQKLEIDAESPSLAAADAAIDCMKSFRPTAD